MLEASERDRDEAYGGPLPRLFMLLLLALMSKAGVDESVVWTISSSEADGPLVRRALT